MSKSLKFSLLGASLLLLAVGTASAAYRCGVFSSQDWGRGAERGYRSCEECLRRNDRCEERCAETGYVCTASGYSWNRQLQRVEGDFSDQERWAVRSAQQRCQNQGLSDCQVEQCADTAQQARSRPCRQERRDDGRGWGDDWGGRGLRPGRPLPPHKKYVVSWQHVKDQCFGKPHPKIAQQCGNKANFWQGVHCRVTWSDGRTEQIGGKVDLTDPYGRKYCTRNTRPPSFNCVNHCDNRPGPLVNLPRP